MIRLDHIPDQTIREEWQHFRAFGWSDDRIAARLGVQWWRVERWTTLGNRRTA